MEELGQDCRALVRCFKAFVCMKIDKGNLIYQDWQNLTVKADFQAFCGLDNKHGTQVVTIDSIQSENPSEPSRLVSQLSSSTDDLFEHDHGITPVSIPSGPSRFGSRLSSSDDDTPVSIPSEPSRLDSRLTSSVDDSHVLAFFSVDDDCGIHVVTEDSIPSECSRLGSRLSSLDGDLLSSTLMESRLSRFQSISSLLGSERAS